jgi:uronate dehydrogenase
MAPAPPDLSQATLMLTGAAGKVARRLRAPLAARCKTLVSTDIVEGAPVAPNERFVRCDLADGAAVMELTLGVERIVHFAGYPREADWAVLIPANIVALTNLWEAALARGVSRVVYASTNHVVGFHPVTRHIDVNAEIKCDSRYGVTKAFAEAVARFYYEKYGIESLGLRIGRVEDQPGDARMLSTWLHPEDLLQLVMLGLTGPARADLLYGISDNAQAWCGNPAGSAYRPRHSADSYTLPPAPAGSAQAEWPFQGGPFAAQDYVGDPARAAGHTNRA